MLSDQTDDKQLLWVPEGDQGKRQNLGTVKSFKYLGAVVSDDG